MQGLHLARMHPNEPQTDLRFKGGTRYVKGIDIPKPYQSCRTPWGEKDLFLEWVLEHKQNRLLNMPP